MEENTNMNEQTTQAENMGNESPAQNKQEKLFTQDEVNAFVKSQVSRMMKKATKDQEADYNRRVAELQAREMKLLLKEKIQERGMARELAEIISGADEDEINQKLDAIEKIYGGKTAEKEESTGFLQVGGPAPSWHNGVITSDPVRKAMGLK